MNAIVIEHVKVSELPEDWRARLHAEADTRVTVRIEEETETAAKENAENPLFGMWQDRAELTDVDAYVRKLRAARF
jgi:hypothetical protein